MKIIITGASGFIGTNLLNSLLTSNDEITLLCRNSTIFTQSLPQNFKIHRVASFTAPINLTCDVLLHMAGDSKWGHLENSNSFQNSTLMLQNLLKTIIFQKIIYISSAAAQLYEQQNPTTLHYYALSKYLNERIIMQKCTNFIIIRPGEVYGIDPQLVTASNLANFTSRIAFATDSVISVTSVEAVARGIKNAIYSKKCGIYDFGGQNVTVRELVKTVQEIGGKRGLVLSFSGRLLGLFWRFGGLVGVEPESAKYGAQDWVQNSSKAVFELGYQVGSVYEIMTDVLSWWQGFNKGGVVS